MWGGVKARAQYGEVLRGWSGRQGLEGLRRRLYREPRPWHLAWSLHAHRHLLSDPHAARLLAWCTAVVALERREASRRQAYTYAQEVFQLLVHSHKVGSETYQEYFRLCATGRDLTAAFRWQQYLVESGQSFPMSHYTWLLHIAALSPSDESAEDMAEAVWESYITRYCSLVKHEKTGETAISHFQPSNEDEMQQLKELFKAFKNLKSRIVHDAKPELIEFINNLPEINYLQSTSKSTWPTISKHQLFPHLESGFPLVQPTLSSPRLRDSILNEEFVLDLENAAFSNNVHRVVELINEYRKRVLAEKEHESSIKYRAGERDIWRCFSDPSSIAFRKPLVEDCGVTAELYHYLIIALSKAQPSMALRTIHRMKESNLRILDLTRAVMIVRCEGSIKEQIKLIKDQFKEIEMRRKIDEDYDITREVELYWKFNYTEFFYYRNALNRIEFYKILMEGLGPIKVQKLLKEVKIYENCSIEDITIFDEDFRYSVVTYYRGILGENEVNKALDDITNYIPKLDISLIGSIQHFTDYILPTNDDIATDLYSLRKKLSSYSNIYILDSSFVETSEYFLNIGNEKNSMVIIPYCCLKQLSSTIDESNSFISFDPALQEGNKTEPFVASQRLKSLFALLENINKERMTRILHFTECLLAHIIDTKIVKMLELNPSYSDNDHLLLILAMIRVLAPKGSKVILCTDDNYLINSLKNKKMDSLFSDEISIISSEVPKEIVEKKEGLINDNPDMCMVNNFKPKLQFPITNQINSISESLATTTTSPPPKSISLSEENNLVSSAWLDMLDEDEKEKEAPIESKISEILNPEGLDNLLLNQSKLKEEYEIDENEKLMNLYESEHAVTPVGVLMAQASSLGSVFDQFDSKGPDDALDISMQSPAPQRASVTEKDKIRRQSPLEREAMKNRGASNKQRFRLAKRLSNMSGGRVPFNFRYRILEVDVTDPRNNSYREAYNLGVAKKRESFKKKFQSSYLVGSTQP